MTLHFTDQESTEFRERNKEIHVHTHLSFLKEHNGLRKGNLHAILGTTGGGKSTLIRSITRDIIFNKENTLRIGFWLSEETVEEYKNQLSYSMPSTEKMLLTTAFSEIENNIDQEFFFTWIKANSLDVLIFDNITTSKFYMDQSIPKQSEFASNIKKITKEMNIATILVAHTEAKFLDNGDRMITANDIRGCKSISNLCEFFYGMQRFEIDGSFYSTIRILKHRGQPITDNTFHLIYNKETRSFIRDNPIPFKTFKEAYDKRSNLRSTKRNEK